MPHNTGTLIHNRYRIVKLIGKGGFGAVYRAWDTHHNRPCALKENLDTSPMAHRQFEREAQILSTVNHPHLARVTDHFVLPGQGQYLVMDLIEGDNLESLAGQMGEVPEAMALTWISQVANGLEYLHTQSQPIIHRDIKPANIRITPEGKAMLVDFGLVKIYDEQSKTTIGARAVTPGYSPPEQYGRGATDARTDIYALAATLYNLLTGKEPAESIQRVIKDTLVPAHRENPRISPATAKAIEQAMAINPEQRFQSALDFVVALHTPDDSALKTEPLPPIRSETTIVMKPDLVSPVKVNTPFSPIGITPGVFSPSKGEPVKTKTPSAPPSTPVVTTSPTDSDSRRRISWLLSRGLTFGGAFMFITLFVLSSYFLVSSFVPDTSNEVTDAAAETVVTEESPSGEITVTATMSETATPMIPASGIMVVNAAAGSHWHDGSSLIVGQMHADPSAQNQIMTDVAEPTELQWPDGTRLFLGQKTDVQFTALESERLVLEIGQGKLVLQTTGQLIKIQNEFKVFVEVQNGLVGVTNTVNPFRFVVNCFAGPCVLHGDLGGELVLEAGQSGFVGSSGQPALDPSGLKSELYLFALVVPTPTPTPSPTATNTRPRPTNTPISFTATAPPT
ncbi:MAG: serine/threonine-protein kinase [Candidatus Promineifilaceae bacterium]